MEILKAGIFWYTCFDNKIFVLILQICGVCFHFKQFMVSWKIENSQNNFNDSPQKFNQANWRAREKIRGTYIWWWTHTHFIIFNFQIGITDPLDAAAVGIGAGTLEKWKHTARNLFHWRKTIAFLCFLPLIILGNIHIHGLNTSWVVI